MIPEAIRTGPAKTGPAKTGAVKTGAVKTLCALGLGLALLATLGGCADPGQTGAQGGGLWSSFAMQNKSAERADLTPAQQCAIGYDLARQIYKIAQVSDTAIRVSPTLGRCGKHAAEYLRRAGFAVDETATRRTPNLFAITTYEDPDQMTVIATATLPGLRLTRAYRRATSGVTPASSFNVIHEGEAE